MKLDTYLILFTNSKCIKDLIVRPKTIKLLEENIREKLHDIEFVLLIVLWYHNHDESFIISSFSFLLRVRS